MDERDILTKQSEAKVNRYIANALVFLGGAMLLVGILNLIGIYDGVEVPIMMICVMVTLVMVGIPFFLVRSNKWVYHPTVKYIVMVDVQLLVLLLAVLLNIHVTMILVLPMLLVTQYRSFRLSLLAMVGSCISCLISPIVAYLLRTWSLMYLNGFIETVCHVEITAMTESAESIAESIGKIILFWAMPQLLLIGTFGVVLYSITRIGVEGMKDQQEIMRLNTKDTLTGLYTKECFSRMTEDVLRRYNAGAFYIAVTDISGLKTVNEYLGRPAGDQLLKNIAEILKEYAYQGICCRLANDGMAVLIAKEDYREEVLSASLRNITLTSGHSSYRVRVYAGVCEVDLRKGSVFTFCDRAHMACNKIKGDYRRRILFYNDEMNREAQKEQEMMTDLTIALEEKQFDIYLQPQFTSERQMIGAEALVRWKHPKKGMIMPGAFIGICEQNGMISGLDYQVWEKAAATLERWKQMGRNDLYISINISPVDLYQKNIYKLITDLVQRYDIEPRNLHLEITETALTIDSQQQTELIRSLRSAGFVVEMDDFGSGYSSLGLLKDIPVNTIKLDMMFIKETMQHDHESKERAEAIVKAIIAMANELKINLICEGVETAEQFELLKSLGCLQYQGYLFSMPISVERFEQEYLQKK